ncbi:MAG: M48 family metallopeptidase [Kiritimatiellae bacterium]|nr:M48 family metallopeptidase [Kiritimatiellia bacterium]
MDFFEQQEAARKRTGRLVLLVSLAVAATVLMTCLAVCFAWTLAVFLADAQNANDFWAVFRSIAVETSVGVISALATLVVVSCAFLWRHHTLRRGGAAVAEAMGGTPVNPQTTDLEERRLLNVVEEMAIAAGVRVPKVYILRRARGINAFAAGYSSDDAAVCVTAGLLDTFTRDEMQAVIGHEFSHILNGDMRLNIRLVSILFGILSISVAGKTILRLLFGGDGYTGRPGAIRFFGSSGSSRRNGKGGGGAVVIAIILALIILGVLLWLIGLVGHFFAQLIQCAISRQREYLADASAVQFTRNPSALVSALKCIGAESYGGLIGTPGSAEVAHMLFAQERPSLFDTHPPLSERIRRYEPGFNGNYGKSRRKKLTAAKPPAGAATLNHRAFRAACLAEIIANHAEAPPLNDADNRALHTVPAATACLLAFAIDWRHQANLDAQRQMALCGFLPAVAASARLDPATLLATWIRKSASWNSATRRAACEIATATLRTLDAADRALLVADITRIADSDCVRTPL